MLETMTSTPEPDDRRDEPEQTVDPAPDRGSDTAADHGTEDTVVGAAGDRPDAAASVADNADEGATVADAGAHDGSTRAMEAPGDAASDDARGAAPDESAAQDLGMAQDRPADAEAAEHAGPDPVDAGSARTEAAGDAPTFGAATAGDAPTFGAATGGAATGGAAAGAATAGGPPPWTSAASGSGTGFVPPWATYRPPPPPPPGTAGFATRYGLVRPVHNRYIAGVCGAFARATNTDPVLWRVALPVLTVLGGFGILVYLLGWLLIPAEGDSASPVESLFRHGRSSTSKLVTIVLGIISVAWIVGTFSTGIGWKIVVAAAVVGAIVVIGSSRGNNGPRWSTRPVEPQPGADPYGYGWYAASGQTAAAGVPAAGVPAAGAPTAGAASTGSATDSAATPGWSVDPIATGTDPIATATGTGWPESTGWHSTSGAAPGTLPEPDPLTDVPPYPTAPGDSTVAGEAGWQSPAYRPPFAPGGPYAQSDPYAPTAAFTNLYDDPAYPVGFPGLTPDAAGAPPPPPPTPPGQRRRSTVARRTTLFATVLVVGVLGILDATNATSVPAPAYFAAALATVGLGLVIGSMFGRVRGPIFLGIVLAIGLVVTSLTSAYHGEQVTIRPASFAELPTTYEGSVGQVTVDLRRLNFTGQDRRIDLQLSAGQILVKLPPNVDAHVVAKVGAGDTMIFGEHNNSGVRAHANVTNDGADGPGGGEITINANIAFAGLVEVKR